MIETIRYPYSINFSLASILLLILFMLLLISNAAEANGTAIWIVCGVIVFMILSLITLLIIKRLIPALKGDTSLELNEQGIIDFIRNVTIDWKDIENIDLMRGRSASTMRIDLKWESDYGKQIMIPLRWVKGKDDEIYNTVIAFLG